jgi:hypothetical protein
MLKLFPIITVSRARNVYRGKTLQDPSVARARRDVPRRTSLHARNRDRKSPSPTPERYSSV